MYNNPYVMFMSRDRFLLLLRSFSFCDSVEYCDTDPNRFVRPIVSYFNSVMKDLVRPLKNLTIDESFVPWRGRLKIRQYIQGKRHKYGVKMYVLTDSNGLTQKMYMYCGSHDVELKGKGHTEKVVMMLLENYLNEGHSVYMDNFYNSVTLAEKLIDNRTYLTGTLRANRLRNPDITRAKIPNGTFLARYNTRGVCVTNYRDKRNVLMISTEHPADLVDYRNKQGRVVQKPTVILEYNRHMKGVDKKDQMLSYYPSLTKTTRWYKKVIYHVMHVMLLNANMMFNEHKRLSGSNSKMPFQEFRNELINYLLNLAL